MSRREDYLNGKITTKLADQAKVAAIRDRAENTIADAVRDIDCPVVRDITLQEIAAAAVTVRCHDGRAAEAGAHASLLSTKAYAASERLTKRRVHGVLV